MSSNQRFKLFSDPVHGFISVPKTVIMDLIQTPEVQRLRRIRQLGVGHLVFPGAEHTRFNHALGAMALMQDALTNLNEKGTPISPEERTAALAVALLHDVGHGAFSHTLEHELIEDFSHEDMSRVLLTDLNERPDGALDTALAMF
ncbi:MAG: HD family phosphohydrolase, partial [Bacteroidetes bacterium QH_2_63_10]